ncbi:MAG: SMC-Scp complex subunit ScpB [Pseudomonadales bacterium]
MIAEDTLKQIVEAALLAADEPLTVDQFAKLFKASEIDSAEIREQIRTVLKTLASEAEGRGYELKRVASGFRYQVRQELSEWVSRLWEEKPPRYSRALLETLALVAYKQPVTRGDIEQIRGVSVSQNIMRTMLERGWIRVVGQREVPGHPAMYGTTKAFLDYFNLKTLDELPPLAEIRQLIDPLVGAGTDIGGAEQEIAVAEASRAAVVDVALTPAADAAAGAEDAATEHAAPVEAVTSEAETAATEEAADDEPHRAEVVQLPTAPH